jgi:hypothetical protein
LLQAPYVVDDIDRLGQLDQGITDELARAVPGDFATSIDVDDRCAVTRPLLRRGPPARGVHRRMLE